MGAVSSLAYAQSIYMLPISLFGMSISAAELPAMSSALGSESDIAKYLNRRLNAGLSQLAFFVIPCIAMFLVLGDLVIGALYQNGKFNHDTTIYVWGVLAGATVGLLASTFGRLYSSTYYSLKDTKTPLGFAVIRVVLTTSLGYLAALKVPAWIGVSPAWGTAGLTSSAGLSGWVEFYLLRRALNPRIGTTGVKSSYVAKLWGAALISAGIAFGLKELIARGFPHYNARSLTLICASALVLSVYGLGYILMTYWLRIDACKSLLKRIRARSVAP